MKVDFIVRFFCLLTAAVINAMLFNLHGQTPEEIEALFGSEVRALVMEVSDDKSLPKAERKRLQIVHAPQASGLAKQLKLADKICNIRDVIFHPPADWSDVRRLEYVAWASAVVAGLRGANPALEDEFDRLVAQAKPIIEKQNSG